MIFRLVHHSKSMPEGLHPEDFIFYSTKCKHSIQNTIVSNVVNVLISLVKSIAVVFATN